MRYFRFRILKKYKHVKIWDQGHAFLNVDHIKDNLSFNLISED